jgi:hypothetical protein
LKTIEHPGGWKIVPIHYSHDPEKDHEWSLKQRAAYEREEDWNSEMELDFTAQLGVPAYPNFVKDLHVKPNLRYREDIPLCIACDFNVDYFIFEICQIINGRLLVIDEICLKPGNVPEMVNELRNLYPQHVAGLHVYGDSNGFLRSTQSTKSDYDLMKIHLKNYPSRITMKVPRAQPVPMSRINALNHRLKGFEDKPYIYIDERCVELIKDFQEVVLDKHRKDVLKIYDPNKSYSSRTHASDALSYLVQREWPLASEAVLQMLKQKNKEKKRRPLRHKRLLGSFE